MNEIQFRSLDLNLFRVLLALIERRSVAAAAADLALTPSAVSHALGRLRASLDDPLFERRAGGLAPTPYALEVAKRAAPAVEQLRRATEALDFDPRTSERQFVLAGGAYAAAVLLPRLLGRLHSAAPRVRIRYVPAAINFADDLEHGRIDIAFGATPPQSAHLEWLPLLQDEMVWAARRDHPFVKAPLTMAMLKRGRHVVLERLRTLLDEYEEARSLLDEAAELRSAYDDALEGAGRTAVVVSDLSHALAIVCGSDAVTLTFRRFAEAMALHELQLLAPPHATPPLHIGATAARSREPGVDWLMRQIGALAEQPG